MSDSSESLGIDRRRLLKFGVELPFGSVVVVSVSFKTNRFRVFGVKMADLWGEFDMVE